jgi:hypothetical protein
VIIKLIFISLLLSNILPIYSEEREEQQNEPIDNQTSEPLLIIKNGEFSFYPYRLSDGTQLRYRNTFTLLESVENNKRLLQQEKRLRAFILLLSFVNAGNLLGYQRYFGDDTRHGNLMGNIFMSASILSSTTMIVTAGIRGKKINKAITNYNLSVMENKK